MKDAVIVSAVRTAVGKAPKGTLRNTRPDEMGGAVIREALARVPGLDATEIEDVIMGCAMPEAEQGMNVARAAAIRAGLPVETSAMTINRFCSSGLQSIAIAADRIKTGSAEVAIGGGLETMSMIPMGGHITRPTDSFGENEVPLGDITRYAITEIQMALPTGRSGAKTGARLAVLVGACRYFKFSGISADNGSTTFQDEEAVVMWTNYDPTYSRGNAKTRLEFQTVPNFDDAGAYLSNPGVTLT